MKQIIVIGLIGSLGFVLIMAGVSVFVSDYSSIPAVTSILAFAPGGVAEMTLTAVMLKANVPFVVAVQTLRLVLIFLVLPPVFGIINYYVSRNNSKVSTASISLRSKV